MLDSLSPSCQRRELAEKHTHTHTRVTTNGGADEIFFFPLPEIIYSSLIRWHEISGTSSVEKKRMNKEKERKINEKLTLSSGCIRYENIGKIFIV